jgi:hypothetical protein
MARTKRSKPAPEAASYPHSEAKAAMRPDLGTQREFKKKKKPGRIGMRIAVEVIDDSGNE